MTYVNTIVPKKKKKTKQTCCDADSNDLKNDTLIMPEVKKGLNYFQKYSIIYCLFE